MSKHSVRSEGRVVGVDLHDAHVLRAEGVLMAVYGLDASEAGAVLRMRAGLLDVDVQQLAARLVERASQLVLDRPTRLHVSELLDLVGTEARPLA